MCRIISHIIIVISLLGITSLSAMANELRQFAVKDSKGTQIATIRTGQSDKGSIITTFVDGMEIVVGLTDEPICNDSLIPADFVKSLESFKSNARMYGDNDVWVYDELIDIWVPSSGDPIEPMISTKWGQGYPFNSLIPEIEGKHALTGCSATALAQLLNYHKSPSHYIGLAGPVSNNPCDWASIADPTDFDFDLMLDEYTMDEEGKPMYSQENVDAVSKLMYYAAQSCHTSYGLDASYALTEHSISALMNIFGYEGADYQSRPNDDQSRIRYWKNVLYKSLEDGYPILVSGGEKGEGHVYLCDGYRDGYYFHLNYGWGGAMNGYYNIHFMTESGGRYGDYMNFYTNIRPDESYNAAIESISVDDSDSGNPNIEIYSVDGQLLYIGSKEIAETLSLPVGVLIVKSDNLTYKYINR